jgi:predicted nucleic-acid-binding protein
MGSEAAINRGVHHAFRNRYSIFVPLTDIFELEWVLRAFYGFGRQDSALVVHHLLGLAHVNIEHWERIDEALEWHIQGLDFADALHLSASGRCTALVSFDDKQFARRVKRLGLKPSITVPK